MEPKKALIGMSGGVDSSVAAYLTMRGGPSLLARMIDVRPVTVAVALFGIGVIIGSRTAVPALIWILCGA